MIHRRAKFALLALGAKMLGYHSKSVHRQRHPRSNALGYPQAIPMARIGELSWGLLVAALFLFQGRNKMPEKYLGEII